MKLVLLLMCLGMVQLRNAVHLEERQPQYDIWGSSGNSIKYNNPGCLGVKWNRVDDLCYLRVKEDKKYGDAKKHCKDKFQGSLAVFRTQAQFDYLLKNAGGADWVGVSKWPGATEWLFDDNQQSFNFVPEQTSFGHDEEFECARVGDDGYLKDRDCDNAIWFWCSRSVIAGGSFCSKGQTFYNGWCYEMVKPKYKKETHQRLCERQGGTLATFHGDAEFFFLVDTIATRNAFNNTYIGLSTTTNGTWAFDDGSNFDFAPGRLRFNRKTNEFCAAIYTNWVIFYLYDIKCDDELSAICQVPPKNTNWKAKTYEYRGRYGRK